MKPQKIKIGWGSRDITPDVPVALRGQFHVRIAQEIKDPLTVTAFALESEDGSEQALMVSADTVAVPEKSMSACREALRKRLPDFNPENMFLNATHTHTGPLLLPSLFLPQADDVMTPEAYLERFVKGLVEACAEAWENRSPGYVAWGLGHAVVGHNRRASYFDGSSRMYGKTNDPEFSHIEGFEDHSVDMLFTYDQDRNMTGLILNMACPSQKTEGHIFVSADFWHETRIELRERLGEKLFVLPQCSAAGDQSPHNLLYKKAEERMIRLKGFLGGESGEEDYQVAYRQEIAERIADAAAKVAPLMLSDLRDELVFRNLVKTINLPKRMVTESDLDIAKLEIAKEEKIAKELEGALPSDFAYSRACRRIVYFQNVLERFEEQKNSPDLPMECHVLRLGDIAFTTNRFELFLDYGLRIKARSRALQTFVVQLSTEGTYLPSARAVAAKSYGAGVESNLVGSEGGQVLVEETLKLLNDLFPENS